MSFLPFSIALVLFIMLILAVPFEFRVMYQRINQDDNVIVQLAGFFGLWKYKINIPMLDWRWAFPPHLRLETITQPASGSQQPVKEEIKPRKLKLPNVIGKFFAYWMKALEIKRWFYKGIRCKHLRWIMEVGFQDAAVTGIAAGGLWSLIGYYIGRLHENITFRVPRPQVAVYPSFNRPLCKVDFDCIFTLRIGHIIIAGFKVLGIVKTVLKGVRE